MTSYSIQHASVATSTTTGNERIPGQGRSKICTAAETAAQGGGVCNLVSQAFVDQEASADLAIQNSGGCRADIAQGDFSASNVYEVLPYNNTMVALEMTGAQIIQVLNEAIESAVKADTPSTGSYPYGAGIRFDVDTTQGFPNYLSNVEVNSRLAATWAAIGTTTTYKVLANSFIAMGGDGYAAFGTVAADKVTELEAIDSSMLFDYALAKTMLVDPPLATYSTQSFTNTTAAPTSDVIATVEADICEFGSLFLF